MSKPVKNLIVGSYKKTFGAVDGAVVIDIRGIKSNDTNKLRLGLAQKQIKVTVVRNALANKAFKETDLANLEPLLDGPSALVYPVSQDASVVSVARELITYAKDMANLTFKGAILDGQLYQADQIEALSKYPTRAEAQAQAIQIILTPGQELVGSILGPGRKVASLIKAIEEKLEKGEAIVKTA